MGPSSSLFSSRIWRAHCPFRHTASLRSLYCGEHVIGSVARLCSSWSARVSGGSEVGRDNETWRHQWGGKRQWVRNRKSHVVLKNKSRRRGKNSIPNNIHRSKQSGIVESFPSASQPAIQHPNSKVSFILQKGFILKQCCRQPPNVIRLLKPPHQSSPT